MAHPCSAWLLADALGAYLPLSIKPRRREMAATAAKILMVLTSHAQLGSTGEPTGVWFEELATPYYAFVDAGAEVSIVSITGGEVPIDPRSVKLAGENEPSVDRFLRDASAMTKIRMSKRIDSAGTAYDAVFLPGGHGTMWDLPASTALAELLGAVWSSGKIVAAVCHGPAGLVNAKDRSGRPIVEGRRVSAFTNSEEEAAGLTRAVPFLLETRLRSLGARVEVGPDFEPYAVADDNLVTGQNPASSALVAKLVMEKLRARSALAAE
jgi:putative intracellular protease/amidase